MRRRAVAGVVAAGMLGAGALVGCQAVLGLGDLSPADGGVGQEASTGHPDADRESTARDAPDASDGSPHDATLDEGANLTDATLPDAACTTAYVAMTGSDSSSGCSSTAPKLTIRSALAVRSALEVLVCAGEYTETNLSIDRVVSLHGSYDCTSDASNWTRAPGWGYPAFMSQTEVSPSMGNTAVATLTIGATLYDTGALSGFTVDGLTIKGAFGPNVSRTEAVLIQGGAAPVFSNDKVIGGSVNATPAQLNVALDIDRAAPSVSRNRITFVTSPGPGPSAAVVVRFDGTARSAAHIYDNAIVGVAGQYVPGAGAINSSGSVGIAFLADGATAEATTSFTQAVGAAFERNAVVAGQGTGNPGFPNAVGVYLGEYAQVDILGNSISGGSSPATANTDAGPPGVPSTAAVQLVNATARLVGNRIWGGQSNSGSLGTAGVYATGSQVVLLNNVIHGGTIGSGDPTVSVNGITIRATDAAVIEDNTVFAGLTGAGTVLTLGSAHGSIIRGNIFAGSGEAKGTLSEDILTVSSCADVKLLEGNVFINTAEVDASPPLLMGCHAAGAPAVTESMKALDDQFAEAGARQHKNFLIDKTCSAVDRDAGACAADCPASGCMPWLLAGWSPTVTSSGALADGGWALADGAVCSVATGGVDLSHAEAGPAVTTDFADAARPSDGSSVGAFQYRAPCH